MRLPNRQVIERLASRTRTGFFVDTAVLLQKNGSGTYDEYNNEIVGIIETTIECSFTDKPAFEAWRNYADIAQIEAEIRFMGIIPTKGDQIKLTGRFETTDFVDETFEVIGIRNRDSFGWMCALKKVAV